MRIFRPGNDEPDESPNDFADLRQKLHEELRERLDLTAAVELFGKEFARDQVRQALQGMLELAQYEQRIQLSSEEQARYIKEVLDITQGLRPEDPD
jgi:hypothetical protein